MEDAIERARRIAPSDIPVLVTGETGTGKELFARSIHRASLRSGHPFLAVNCAAVTETLLEAELFGHVKGAFTGATSAKAGIFEAANGGTVFLDEIGKAPLTLQAKLLRVLDTGEVRRVGGVEPIHVDVRIVAATNRSLPALADAGEFLPDLFYRLRGFEIEVPALRERRDDVALLFERFAGRPASESALELLELHDWPGNVRELRNLAESASFLTFGRGPIPLDALPDWIREVARRPRPMIASLEETERGAVEKALEEAGGNRSRAARALGVSRQTLYTKMAKYGIGREAGAASSRTVSGAAA
jgi:transcriptional regulator with PAS, ATPase and Fis domain